MEFQPKINSKVWALHSDLNYPGTAGIFHVKDLGDVELTDVDIQG